MSRRFGGLHDDEGGECDGRAAEKSANLWGRAFDIAESIPQSSAQELAECQLRGRRRGATLMACVVALLIGVQASLQRWELNDSSELPTC